MNGIVSWRIVVHCHPYAVPYLRRKARGFGTILSALKGDSRGALSDRRKCRKPRQWRQIWQRSKSAGARLFAPSSNFQNGVYVGTYLNKCTFMKRFIEIWFLESLCLKAQPLWKWVTDLPRLMVISIVSQKRGKLVGLAATRPHCASWACRSESLVCLKTMRWDIRNLKIFKIGLNYH